MKLATYAASGVEEPRVGVVDADTIYPFPIGWTMRDVIDAGLGQAGELAGNARTRTGLSLADVRLLPPLKPASVRDFVAFEEHVQGVRQAIEGTGTVPDAWYDAPTFYFTNPHALLGPDDEVCFPGASQARDLELEVAVVVGKPGSSLSVAEAAQHVFGYTIMNDWSARDVQGREMQVGLGPAKGKDFGTTLGPWIVTADELEPYRDAEGFLDLWCTIAVNGDEIGRDLLSGMGWTFETLIAYASRDSAVEAGDVLGSGTVGNGGCLAELWGLRGRPDPPPLRPGDVVEMTVEGIGTIRNRIVPGLQLPPVRAARPRPRARKRLS